MTLLYTPGNPPVFHGLCTSPEAVQAITKHSLYHAQDVFDSLPPLPDLPGSPDGIQADEWFTVLAERDRLLSAVEWPYGIEWDLRTDTHPPIWPVFTHIELPVLKP